MCGIAGIQGHSSKIDVSLLKMQDAMRHRGPDDSGVYADSKNQIGLAHTRLSIIDLTQRARQPMRSKDGRYIMVYNGEVYNFKDMRNRLIEEGHTFDTDSDAEVVLRLYEEKKEQCLDGMRGMFAFAVWDNAANSLFLARDRLGIKPLYYYNKDGRFIFSSELRSMLASGLISNNIDMQGATDYFTYGSAQSPYTMIEGIRQLLPGHHMVLKDKKLVIKQYWNLESVACSQKPDKDELTHIADIKAGLDEAVKVRMVSDVPLGAFLSGGIDSSSVVALMQCNSSKPIRTFSVIFEENEYDERVFSHKIVQKYNTDHKEILLSSRDILKNIPAAFDAMDQPSVDGFNTFIISKAVKNAGITVALSGIGGDELFAGYNSFKTLPLLNNILKIMQLLPRRTRKSLSHRLRKTVNTRGTLKAIFSLLDCNNLDELYLLKRRIFLDKELALAQHADVMPGIQHKRGKYSLESVPAVDKLSFLELSTYLRNTLLMDADCMSMAHALEVRTPFLDHLLVEKMFQIPAHTKIGRDYPKRLLVKAMADMLPESVYKRPKMGFTLPFDNWLKSELKDYCEFTLSEANIKNTPFLDSINARKIWSDFKNGSRFYNYISVLALVSFVNWHKKISKG